MRNMVLIFVASMGLAASPAAAQGVFDLGALTNTISQSAAQQQAAGQAVVPPSAQSLAKLNFQPSPTVRKQVVATFVEAMRSVNADAASQVEAAFGQVDIIDEISKGLAPYGLKTDNMADAYTFYLLTAWMAANGRSDDNTPAQIAGVQNMVRTSLGSIPQITSLKDADKQQFAEGLLLQGMLYDAMGGSAASDPAMKAKVGADVKAGAKVLGIDLDAFILTPTGLVRK